MSAGLPKTFCGPNRSTDKRPPKAEKGAEYNRPAGTGPFGGAAGNERIPRKEDEVKADAEEAAAETKGESSAGDVADAGTNV
ncbi:hypothetical protein V490_09224 [Pseudogymnoascus sp. VKM F-3557]|nr:hypothetical protein V490_09224 [Pseudogymnoascus sp. VKM F-3557]